MTVRNGNEGKTLKSPGGAGGKGYAFHLWKDSGIIAASGNAASLPSSYAAVAVQNGNSATWDVFDYSGGTASRDGQAMDQLIAGPSLLRLHLDQSGTDLTTAETTTA